MDAVAIGQVGSLEALAQARIMGIPDRAAHLFSVAGLEAVDRQRKAWDERTSRPGAFGRYCETVADAYLRASGCRAVNRKAA